MIHLIVKSRKVSLELQLHRYLIHRTNFPEKTLQYYNYLEKGYQGEIQFDQWLEKITVNSLILNDLLFEINQSHFQIDSLLILPKSIYLFEVKNYEGDYEIKDDRWITSSGSDIKNPLLQLKRSETLLRLLLQKLSYRNIEIISLVVFVHPEMTLFNASRLLPIIYPTQLSRFIKNINSDNKGSKLNQSHYDLSKKLISQHIDKPPYSRIPEMIMTY